MKLDTPSLHGLKRVHLMIFPQSPTRGSVQNIEVRVVPYRNPVSIEHRLAPSRQRRRSFPAKRRDRIDYPHLKQFREHEHVVRIRIAEDEVRGIYYG